MKSSTNAKLIKLFRIIFWGVSIVFISVGASLMRLAETSASYADGTVEAKYSRGQAVFVIALIVGILNLIWGITRWILRWRREKWTAGKVIGKLIGGGIWRTLAIIPVILLSLIFLAPVIAKNIDNRVLASTADLSSSSQKIIQDYDNETITADQYANYQLASIYGLGELPQKYQSDAQLFSDDSLLSFTYEHFDELESETVIKIIEANSFNNLVFDPDASSNKTTTAGLFASNAYASEPNVTTLNKAQKTSAGHFVVFYTDQGDDKISDSQAKSMGDMLEDIIRGYKDSLGLDWEYSPKIEDISSIQNVLKANGLDENILNNAMPIFVMNPYDKRNSIQGSYNGTDKKDITQQLLVLLLKVLGGLDGINALADNTPILPFVHMMPYATENMQNTKLVMAHELGHHFNNIYCRTTRGSGCALSSQGFIDETMPNYLSVNVVDGSEQAIGDDMNKWHQSYINNSTRFSINKDSGKSAQGYPVFAFLQNYIDIVPNGLTKAFEAVARGGNSLKYLYESSSPEDFLSVMTTLGQKNLTNDYGDKKALYSSDIPKGEKLDGCLDICSNSFSMNPASLAYLYFPARSYQDKKIQVTVGENETVSILGLAQNRKWEIIKQASNVSDYTIHNESQYKTIAFVVANGSISDKGEYQLKISSPELFDDLGDAGGLGDFAFSLPTDILTPIGDGCYAVNTNSLMEIPRQMLGLGDNLLKLVETIGTSEDYSALRAEYNAESQELQQGISEVKAELAQFYVTICANVLNETNFDSAKSKVQSSMGFNMNINDYSFDGYRTSMFVGGDIMTQTAKLYSLNQLEDGLFLITLNIKEK